MMRVVCIDDEKNILDNIVSICRDIPTVDETYGFTKASDALAWLRTTSADIAILDIEMPDMNGIILAARIKEKQPDVSIIFVTEHPKYAVDAFALHVSGYLLKPVTKKRLAAEIEYALTGKHRGKPAHIKVVTFDGFDVFVDRKQVSFKRTKSKELLAYLVDKRGNSADRREVFAALWESGEYDRAMQKRLDVVIHSLKTTLKEYGISEILENRHGVMRVVPEMLDCDIYRFLKGDAEAVNAYRGRYMPAYSWATVIEGTATWELMTDDRKRGILV